MIKEKEMTSTQMSKNTIKASFESKMKKALTYSAVFSISLLFTSASFAKEYVAPPSSSTHGSVPVISDAAMEKCVKIYNEAKWLAG